MFGRVAKSLAAGLFLALPGTALAQAFAADTVAWSVAPQDIAPKAKHATLTLHGAVTPGWHVYALKQLPDGPTPLLVSVAANDVAAADGAPAGSVPTKLRDAAFGLETQFYSSDFTLTVPVRLKSGAGTQAIPIDVRFQTCNGRVCQPPKTVHLSAAITRAEK